MTTSETQETKDRTREVEQELLQEASEGIDPEVTKEVAQISTEEANKVLKKNIFFQYLLQIALYVFPFITLPYLTRVLGPDEFAVRAYAVSIMAIVVTLVDYGFNTYGTREAARNKTNLPFLSKLSSTVVVLRIGLALAGGAVILAITPFIPIMAENPLYMIIAYVGVCLNGMLPDFIFQGLEDMGILTKRFVVSRIVSLILIFVFVRSSDDLILVAVFETVPSIIAFVWSWWDVVFKRKIKVNFKLVDLKYAKEVFKTSSIFFLSSASTTIFTSLTTVMIGIYITDPAEISYWSLSMTAIAALQCLFGPIVNSAYPHMVAHRRFSVMKKFLVIGLPVVAVGTVAFAVCANLVMFILGGVEYLPGTYVMQLVSPILLLSYPAMLIGFPVLAAINKEKELTTSSVVSAVFHIVGLVVLASFGIFTIAAVAILRCCTEFVLLLLRAIFVFKNRKLISEDSK